MKILLHRIDSFFNSLIFAKKCLLLFFCGAVIPLAVQNVVYYWQTERKIQGELLEKVNEGMDDKADKINSTLAEILSYARSCDKNEDLYRGLDYEYGGDMEFLVKYQELFQTLFSDRIASSVQIRRISVYTENLTMFDSFYVRRMDGREEGELGEHLTYLNMDPLEGKDGIYFRVAHEEGKFQGVQDSRSVSILCRMNYYKQFSKYKKLLRVDINMDYLEDILKESSLFENMLLTDSQGHVIAAASGYSNRGEPDVFDVSLNGEEKGQVLLERKVGEFPLTLYGIYDSGMISEEFQQSRKLSMGITVLCLLFASVCVYFITSGINRRLRRLVEQSGEIARGNFVRTKDEDSNRDEFGILERSINRMSAQLQELIEKEYKAEIQKIELEKETNQAKLLALQAQVNPHFMFNALESIRLKALAKGEKETADVIKYMARMFRNLISWEDNIITLREEIRFLDEFLHIQNYRFDDEFFYEIEIEEQAYGCLVPKMILQPLVENACVHGVEAVSEDRWVRVEGALKEEGLVLTVRDNGGGMSSEKLSEIREVLSGNGRETKSVGVLNAYRRLVLYYGEDFQFTIDSYPGQGTVCRLRIPVKEETLCIQS